MFSSPLSLLIADLSYGDAGKGSIVDYLTRAYHAHTVVRYNGGAQAAHNVITPDGRHHTFAQFGSGTFLPGVRTHLSRYMLLHPLAMLSEERHLRALGVPDAFARTSIERGALVVTPFQQAANRLKELARGEARHGSCGMGIGESMADWLAYGDSVLFAGDLADHTRAIQKLAFLRDAKIAQLEPILASLPPSAEVEAERRVLFDANIIETTADVYQYFAGLVSIVEPDVLATLLNRPGVTIFEGAQGVLLDEWYGFYPYNSWSTLTFQNADTLLSENRFNGDTFKLGLTRAYATRHGAGPFVTEDPQLSAAVPDSHNANNLWQRQFRVGSLDLVALRYALRVTGPVDALAVTNLDRLAFISEWKTCSAYQHPGNPALADYFALRAGAWQDIKIPADPTDLKKQETLTRLLMEMQPVYTTQPRHLDAYLEHISTELGLPIALTSSGPSAREKAPSSVLPLLNEDRVLLRLQCEHVSI